MAAVDVAIIGGGIVGMSAAAELAAAGARVRVYERATIAAGASGRNSGAIWRPFDAVFDALYRESLERYRDLEAHDLGLALPAEPVGILSVGWDGAALAAIAAELAHTHPSFEPTFVDEGELRSLEPSVAPGLAAYRLAIGYPLAPAAATRAYAALARARGADLREGVAASVAIERARVAGIRLDGVVERADVVIVAAGPWTPAVIDPSGGWRPIRASWGVVVELALSDPPRHVVEEAEVIEAAIEPGRSADDGGAVGFSMVTAAGISSLGSTFLPEEPDPSAFVSSLRERGAQYVPSIALAEPRGIRNCARPLSRDGHPLVGAVPGIDGLFVAAGHGPWGISTGPASGAHVAGLALGDKGAVPEALRAAVDPARFGQPSV